MYAKDIIESLILIKYINKKKMGNQKSKDLNS